MDMLSRLTAVRKRYSGKRLFAFGVVLTTFWILPIDVDAQTKAQCSYAGLTKLTEFGYNPGNLKAYYYKPSNLPPNSPLVVALHGCGQNACDYDDETGWKALAQRFKFALLLPEQQKLTLGLPPSGNPANCFSWWQTSLGQRVLGEPKSIINMIKRMIDKFDLDSERIYVTGLSAGAGMTVTMLSDYPDCFAGGAPMAGVPFNCAELVVPTHAVGLECMCIDVKGMSEQTTAALGVPGKVALAEYEQKHAQCARMEEPVPGRTARDWGDRVRYMADNAGATKWPRISIWQGAKDPMVAPINMKRLMLQWTNVHGLDPAKGTAVQELPASPYDAEHTTYADTSGRVQVETYLVKSALPAQQAPATGHATAIDPDNGCGCGSVDCACEKRGVCDEGNKTGYIKDANICSSLRVAQFWGLDQPTATRSGAQSSTQRCKALR